MIPVLAQIVQRYLLGRKIEELAKDEVVKAREFSYSAQVYLLMLGQLAHVFSLNELVDLSSIFSGELRRIRGIESVKLSTFSLANRTRSPSVGRRFFWFVYETFTRRDPAFARPRHKGVLAKFRMRGIYAIDSTTIQLAYWCIKWAKHRQRKAAVKVHMVANVAHMLPMFAVVGKAKEHDSVREEEMFSSLGLGDVGVADRAYNNFRVLYRQTVRGVFFVVREKERTRHKVVSRVAKKALPESIVADETIRLTGTDTQNSYPVDLRRVTAMVDCAASPAGAVNMLDLSRPSWPKRRTVAAPSPARRTAAPSPESASSVPQVPRMSSSRNVGGTTSSGPRFRTASSRSLPPSPRIAPLTAPSTPPMPRAFASRSTLAF